MADRRRGSDHRWAVTTPARQIFIHFLIRGNTLSVAVVVAAAAAAYDNIGLVAKGINTQSRRKSSEARTVRLSCDHRRLQNSAVSSSGYNVGWRLVHAKPLPWNDPVSFMLLGLIHSLKPLTNGSGGGPDKPSNEYAQRVSESLTQYMDD